MRQEDRAKTELRRIIRAAESLHGDQRHAKTAIAIERGLTFTIAKLRREGREAGARALSRELALARSRGIFVEPGIPQDTTGFDLARSQVIARRFASDWYTRALMERDATALLDSRIDTIGITETAESFTAESKAILATATQRTDGTMVLFEFWDAALDRRTCPICERASGTVVLLGMGFPAGRPGGVHPRCRCNGTVIPMPIWFTREIETDEIYDYPEALEAA